MKIVLFALLISAGNVAWGNILVLEYKGEQHDDHHGKSVEWIACKNSKASCILQYTAQFVDDDFIAEYNRNLQSTNIVNMSFTIQKPSPFSGSPFFRKGDYEIAKEKHDKVEAEFEKDHKAIIELIESNPDKFYVTVAGNGVPISNFRTLGIGLKFHHQLYPQVMEKSNLIKVAALDVESFDIQAPTNYNIASYSNYGLFYVDVAAPVEANHEGEVIDGTSFASPYTARLIDDVLKAYGPLKPGEMRNLLLRSCHIKNIEKALWATQDLLENKEESVVYKSMFMVNRKKRMEINDQYLSDVILVQCGGAVDKKLAMSCARNYKSGSYISMNQACLEAHKDLTNINSIDQSKLVKMWELRFEESLALRVGDNDI